MHKFNYENSGVKPTTELQELQVGESIKVMLKK